MLTMACLKDRWGSAGFMQLARVSMRGSMLASSLQRTPHRQGIFLRLLAASYNELMQSQVLQACFVTEMLVACPL